MWKMFDCDINIFICIFLCMRKTDNLYCNWKSSVYPLQIESNWFVGLIIHLVQIYSDVVIDLKRGLWWDTFQLFIVLHSFSLCSLACNTITTANKNKSPNNGLWCNGTQLASHSALAHQHLIAFRTSLFILQDPPVSHLKGTDDVQMRCWLMPVGLVQRKGHSIARLLIVRLGKREPL